MEIYKSKINIYFFDFCSVLIMFLFCSYYVLLYSVLIMFCSYSVLFLFCSILILFYSYSVLFCSYYVLIMFLLCSVFGHLSALSKAHKTNVNEFLILKVLRSSESYHSRNCAQHPSHPVLQTHSPSQDDSSDRQSPHVFQSRDGQSLHYHRSCDPALQPDSH